MRTCLPNSNSDLKIATAMRDLDGSVFVHYEPIIAFQMEGGVVADYTTLEAPGDLEAAAVVDLRTGCWVSLIDDMRGESVESCRAHLCRQLASDAAPAALAA